MMALRSVNTCILVSQVILYFFLKSFKLLSHEYYKKNAMDILIKIICFSNKCKFSEFKSAVYC